MFESYDCHMPQIHQGQQNVKNVGCSTGLSSIVER